MHTVGTGWLWLVFFCVVAIVLFVDMFVLDGRKTHMVSTREALSWTLVWVLCALLFNLGLWFYLKSTSGYEVATQKALEFFTAYVIEESLSVDNMFMFIMIFSYFSVPQEYQRRILLYGVLGAIFMRMGMIFSGTWLFYEYHWILYVFGAFLIFTGVRMFFLPEKKRELEQESLVIFLKKHLRFTEKSHEEKFFVRQNTKWVATPLFLVLILIEITDLIFALDSIPAVFAVTLDSFIVVTSNIFAIMGLRALYFLLKNIADRYYLLKYGIALVLVFVGIKMLISRWLTIPILVSLGIIVAILATTVILSSRLQFKKER